MFGGVHWTLVLMGAGCIIALVVVLADNSEIRKEKAIAISHASVIPFLVMMCESRGEATFIDFLFLTFFVVKLKNALMAIWEYYDPSPW